MTTIEQRAFTTHDDRFREVLGDEPQLAKVADVDAHEGPVYAPYEDSLYFTTLPKPGPLVSIKRLDLVTGELTTLREDANGANGMTLDLDGDLVVCEQGTPATRARISRVDRATGEAETILDEF